LRSVSRLRPLPGNTARLLKALDDPRVTPGEISDLLALDQALTAYILRVANSATLGYAMSCTSLQDAVMRLGFKQIRSLVVTTMTNGPLTSRLSGYRLGDKELWYHSIAVASASHWLAGVLRFPDPEKAYISGLLHDIGKLLLDQYVLVDYQQVVTLMRRHKVSLWQVEAHLYGFDHAAVGGLMAAHWQFPAELANAIRFHHMPAVEQPEPRLAAIVNLANALIDSSPSSLSELEGRVIHSNALLILNLDAAAVERLRVKLNDALFEYQARQLTVSTLPPDRMGQRTSNGH
jgi:putative nucleotidyltransferase with HDIG domain